MSGLISPFSRSDDSELSMRSANMSAIATSLIGPPFVDSACVAAPVPRPPQPIRPILSSSPRAPPTCTEANADSDGARPAPAETAAARLRNERRVGSCMGAPIQGGRNDLVEPACGVPASRVLEARALLGRRLAQRAHHAEAYEL